MGIFNFFKNDYSEGIPIPVPNTLTSAWNDLIKQVRNTSNKKSSLYPTYFLWFVSRGFGVDGNLTHYGSFIDPSGKISKYNYSNRQEEVLLPFTNVLEDNEMNEFIDNLPDNSRYAQLHQEVFGLPTGTEALIGSIHSISQEISRKELLKFINNLKKKDTEYNFKINLDETIRGVTESTYTTFKGGCDMPTDYSCILVYDEIKDTYKEIVFGVYGGWRLFNNSSYKLNLNLEYDGEMIRKALT